jgi:acetyl-CoA carboxylase carboxyltransferase component
MTIAATALAATEGTPASRLERLCDAGSLEPLRTAVGDGVLAGRGRIAGRTVYAWAQDGSHLGGSLGAAGGETIQRTIALADRAGVPVVGFAHSGGARLQEGPAGLHAYAGIFRHQARATVPQITVVAGPCAGGAAYSPALGDVTIMAGEEARMFLTGPRIVERVMGEAVSTDELGGPRVHERNGVAHLRAEDDAHACDLVRTLLAHLPQRAGGSLPLAPPAPPQAGDPAEVLPDDARQVYDVRAVARRLVDAGELLELAPRWARNMVVGLARMEGHPLGVIANQPRHLGGVIDADAADKGAWFVDLCDRFGVPLLVLVDTPGFLPGTGQERDGVIRRGAALVRAFAVASVPRVTVTVRQAFGGAHIVMNCRDLGADLTLAWPGARIGVMGAEQAIELVHRRELRDGADPAELAASWADQHLPAERAAEAGFVDQIVDPLATRASVCSVLGASA